MNACGHKEIRSYKAEARVARLEEALESIAWPGGKKDKRGRPVAPIADEASNIARAALSADQASTPDAEKCPHGADSPCYLCRMAEPNTALEKKEGS